MSLRKQVLLVAALCLLSVGCSRGIKEGVYAVTGSSGNVVFLHGGPASTGLLARRYRNIIVGPFTNDVGAVCPPEFINALPAAISDELRYRSPSLGERFKRKDKKELGPFFTGPAGKTLRITGRVIHYETSGLGDKALSPLEEAICRVRIQDDDTNALLAEANCIGRVKSSVRTGPREMAQGVGKAVRKMLKPTKE